MASRGRRRHRLGTCGEHRAQPRTGSACGQNRRQSPRRRDAARRQHRHRHQVQHLGEQRQRTDTGFAVAATFRATRHQHIDPGIDRGPRRGDVGHLGRHRHPVVVGAGHPRKVAAETHRQQRGPRGQRHVEQVRFGGHHPMHQPDAERPAQPRDVPELCAQLVGRRRATHPDHAEPARTGHRSCERSPGRTAHRRVHDRRVESDCAAPRGQQRHGGDVTALLQLDRHHV
jgi:hypothetical protein